MFLRPLGKLIKNLLLTSASRCQLAYPLSLEDEGGGIVLGKLKERVEWLACLPHWHKEGLLDLQLSKAGGTSEEALIGGLSCRALCSHEKSFIWFSPPKMRLETTSPWLLEYVGTFYFEPPVLWASFCSDQWASPPNCNYIFRLHKVMATKKCGGAAWLIN